MSSDDFEKRIDNQLATVAENQARFDENMGKMQEAINGLIQVARIHNEQIGSLQQKDKEQQERIDALIRIVEGHVSDHP